MPVTDAPGRLDSKCSINNMPVPTSLYSIIVSYFDLSKYMFYCDLTLHGIIAQFVAVKGVLGISRLFKYVKWITNTGVVTAQRTCLS